MAYASSGFAERLRGLRKQKNLSQTELGKLAVLHYTRIGRFERALFTIFAVSISHSKEAKSIEKQLRPYDFTSTLTKLPKTNWNKQIDQLNIEKDLKDQVKITLNNYLKKMSK